MDQKDLFMQLDNFNRDIIKNMALQATFEESKKGKCEILMPDAKTIKGNSDLDAKKLKEQGISEIFGPGTDTRMIVEFITKAARS